MSKGEKVGILGSGDVGKQLASGFARHGYEVVIGTRDPAKLETWRKNAPQNIRVGSFSDAASHGQIVIIATKGEATEAAIDLAGVKNFKGKLVLDAANPLDFSKGMSPALFVGTTDSLGERVQRKLPDAHVVKCFNTVGNAKMIDPAFKEGVPPMFICGNDAASKKKTEAVLKELGWPGALDVGGIDGARYLEALVPLWVRTAMVLNTAEHAFKVVR